MMSDVIHRLGRNICIKRALLIFALVFFYCDLAIYLSLAISARLEPQYWLGLLMLLTIIWSVATPRLRYSFFNTPLFIWCVLFIGINLASYFLISASHIEQFKGRIRDAALLLTLLSLFIMLADQLIYLRKFILLAVVCGVIINIISIFHCDYLIPAQYGDACRSAGLYINPNDSAIALLFGMIFSIGTIPKAWRIVFAFCVMIGVVVTFSREAIAGWLAITFMFCILGVIEWRKLLLWLAVSTVSTVLLLVVAIKTGILNAAAVSSYTVQLRRLVWFVHGLRSGASVDIRLKLLAKGWEMFLKHPWIGNGIGSTDHWNLPYSTHNIYLYYMDDFGLAGLLLFPMLVWSVVYGSRGAARTIGWCMAVFLLLIGLFNHDLVHSYYSLFSLALMAAMTRSSQHASVPSADAQMARLQS
ncbi:MAG: O-antigen ligase family protein [Gammaproteobacteria bacterium]|nr:O-antigen ligase family protein [Gammaproteobacteria bacterium]